MAQVVGHTVLLYRPANPPSITLEIDESGGAGGVAGMETDEEGLEGDGIEG